MKKIISIFLCLVLIFSLSVCSFAIDIGNWPTYFTGQWDRSILNDLDGIKADLQAYLPNISTWSEQMNINLSSFLDLVVLYYPTFSANLVNLNTKVYDLNTFIQQDFYDLVDFRAGDIISAISGTTSAVRAFDISLSNLLDYKLFDLRDEDSLGYMIHMLQLVLADEEDLAFKEKNRENAQAVVDFAETGASNSDISYLSSINSSIQSFDFISNTFYMDFELPESFEYIQEALLSTDAWMWFTQSNKNDINGFSSALFTRGYSDLSNSDLSNDVEIVTDYYGENKRKLTEFLGGRIS